MLERSSNAVSKKEEKKMFALKILAANPVSLKQIEDGKQRIDDLAFAIRKIKYISQGHKANHH